MKLTQNSTINTEHDLHVQFTHPFTIATRKTEYLHINSTRNVENLLRKISKHFFKIQKRLESSRKILPVLIWQNSIQRC